MSTTDTNNGEPEPKRTRTAEEGEQEDVAKMVEDAAAVQLEVEGIFEQETQEILRVQSMFAQKRLDAYARRRKFLESVPQFWLDVVCVVLACSFVL